MQLNKRFTQIELKKRVLRQKSVRKQIFMYGNPFSGPGATLVTVTGNSL